MLAPPRQMFQRRKHSDRQLPSGETQVVLRLPWSAALLQADSVFHFLEASVVRL